MMTGNGRTDMTGFVPVVVDGDVDELVRADQAQAEETEIEGPTLTLENIGSYEPTDEELMKIGNRILQNETLADVVTKHGLSFEGLLEKESTRFFVVGIWRGLQMSALKEKREAELAEKVKQRRLAEKAEQAEKQKNDELERALRSAMKDALGLTDVDDITASLERVKAEIKAENVTESAQLERKLGDWEKALREYNRTHPGVIHPRYRNFEIGGLVMLMAAIRFWMVRSIRSIQGVEPAKQVELPETVQRMLGQHERWLQHELDVVAEVLKTLGYDNPSEAKASFKFRGTVRDEVAYARSAFFPLFLSAEELIEWEAKYTSYHVPDLVIKAIADEDQRAKLEEQAKVEAEAKWQHEEALANLFVERAGQSEEVGLKMARRVINKYGNLSDNEALQQASIGRQLHAENTGEVGEGADRKNDPIAITYLMATGISRQAAQAQLPKLVQAKIEEDLVMAKAKAEESRLRHEASIARIPVEPADRRQRYEEPKSNGKKGKGRDNGDKKEGKGKRQ